MPGKARAMELRLQTDDRWAYSARAETHGKRIDSHALCSNQVDDSVFTGESANLPSLYDYISSTTKILLLGCRRLAFLTG